jgi:hypothetical protein
MKTPREILFERHRAAETRLDAIRHAVIADEFNPPATQAQGRNGIAVLLACLTAPWRELILPSRRVWMGLAAVWALMFIINLSQRDTVSSVTGQPVRSAPMMMSWQLQQRLMNEVLADRVAPPEADRPRNSATGPRSENNQRLMT